MAQFLAYSIGNLCLQLGILCHQLVQQLLDGLQNAFLGLAHQQAAVIGSAAVLGNNRCAGIGSGLDVGQFQDTVAQYGMMGGNQSANCLNDLSHLVNSIDTLLGVGRVAGNAEGFHDDLATATLSDLDVQLGSFADDNIVRLDEVADFASCDTFKALLVNDTGNIDFTCEILARVLCECSCCGAEACYSALHIAGATTVDLAVVDLSSEGGILPLGFIRNRDGIDVAVEENLLARTVALDAADDVAVLVNGNAVKALGGQVLAQSLHNTVFVAGVALLLDQLLAKGNNLLLSFIA